MLPLIEQHRAAVEELCRRYHVRRLEIFGSAARGTFQPGRSDLDFLVEFSSGSSMDAFHQYFDLRSGLEAILGCRVDLVMIGAMKNPYFVRDVNRSRRLVYES